MESLILLQTRLPTLSLLLYQPTSRVGTPLWLSSYKETKYFFTAHSYRFNIVGSLRDWEVACSASECQGSNFESCVRRAVSSQSSYHPQVVLLVEFILHLHKGVLKPHSFHFLSTMRVPNLPRKPRKPGKWVSLFLYEWKIREIW